MPKSSATTTGFSEDEAGAIVRELRGMPEAFAALFSQEAEETLHHRAADGWSAVEVVWHLADHDAFERTRRFEAILNEEIPVLPDDHTRLSVASANADDRPAADTLAFFQRERGRLVALLERLGPREWMRTGILPRDGERALLQVADLRGHDREHFEQAVAAIAAAKG